MTGKLWRELSRTSLSPMMETVPPGDKAVGVPVHSGHPTAGVMLKGEPVPWGHSRISVCDVKTLGTRRTESGSVQCTVGRCSTARSAETRWSCRCVVYTQGLCCGWSDGAGGEMPFMTRFHLGTRKAVRIPCSIRVLCFYRSRSEVQCCVSLTCATAS